MAKGGQIIPIEVKNSASGSLKSLHLLLATYPNIKEAYIFTDGRYGAIKEQRLQFFPLYFAGSKQLFE